MFDTLEMLAFALWTIFVVYATWYLTSAKRYAPLTPYEARILWKIHKQNIACDGKKWQIIKRGGKIIGFKCECGYKHIQKRPIVSSTPMLPMHTQVSAIRKEAKINKTPS
ncbi:MAG: hypothetical protein ACUVQX_06550 [Candidatus Bathycorpusculaceae bacterium]